MKHVDTDLLILSNTLTMTKADKLERWASLVEKYDGKIQLLDRLETWKAWLDLPLAEMGYHDYSLEKKVYYKTTAFQIAADDVVFKHMGLTDSVRSAMKFFEVTQKELHYFSCNCGGMHSKDVMAKRIRAIADPTWTGWFKRLFW